MHVLKRQMSGAITGKMNRGKQPNRDDGMAL